MDTGIVEYNSGGWRSFGTTSNGVVTKELLPIKYTFRLTYNGATVSKAQNIDSNATIVFQTIPTTVKLQTSTGTPLDTGIVQFDASGWKNFGTTLNGVVTKELLPTKYNFRMTYNGAAVTKSQSLDSNATVVFHTIPAIVQLQTSTGAPLDTGIVEYNSGGWRSFGTTLNGVITKELLSVKYTFRITYNSATISKAQNIDSNSTVVFQTIPVQVQLQTSAGLPLDTGYVQYNSGGWRPFGTTSNGVVSSELLPTKYNFRITYNSATVSKAQNVDSNSTVIFQTIPIRVQLQSSIGNPLDTGTVQYNSGGWKDFGTTFNGIATKELLPGTYNFKMTYAFSSMQKKQNTDSSSTIIFQTVNTIVQLQNSKGLPLDTGTVQYNSGGWKPFGNTTNGIASKELLANQYNFRMTYAYINNDKTQSLDSSATVNFSTVLCTVHVTNSSGQAVNNAIVTYSSGKPFGTTVSGITTKELLPASITFKAQSGKTTQTKTQDISTNPVVEIVLP